MENSFPRAKEARVDWFTNPNDKSDITVVLTFFSSDNKEYKIGLFLDDFRNFLKIANSVNGKI